MARNIISAHGVDFATASLEAAKPLTLNGVDYHDGDPIPAGIISARTGRMLFEQRRIRIVLNTVDPVAPAEPVPAPLAPDGSPAATDTPPAGPKAASAPETLPPLPDPATLLAATGWTAVHEGFGRWFAVNGEAKVGPFKKADIEHLLS